MKQIKNRLIAVVLALTVAIGLLPMGALASGEATINLDEVRQYFSIDSERFGKPENQNKALEFFIYDEDGQQLAYGKTDIWNHATDDYRWGKGGYRTKIDFSLLNSDEYEVVSSTYDFSDGSVTLIYDTLINYNTEEKKVWEITLAKRTNNVTFLNDDATVDTQAVPYGDTVTAPTPAPEKDGYTFLGWYADGEETPFDFSTAITAPLTLTANWEAIEVPAPMEYPYTLTIEYRYNNNGNTPENLVPVDVLKATLVANAATIAGYAVQDVVKPGEITVKLTAQQVDKQSKFDYSPFAFETLADTTQTPLNNEAGNVNFNSGNTQIAPALIYKNDGGEPTEPEIPDPEIPKPNAWFFIRTDGLIPMEDGTTHYPGNQYLPVHSSPTPLLGTVLKESSWSKNYGPIEGDTINGIKLSAAFAEVQKAIANTPEQEAIDKVLDGLKGYNPETQGVMWYVVKTMNHADHGCFGRHVDGVLYTKGSTPTDVRVLNYMSNIPGNDSLLAYAIVGLGANATVGQLIPPREGYNFVGWNTQADGKGTGYKAGDTIKMDADYTLYAQWERKEYTVTYEWTNAPKNESLPTAGTVSHGDPYTVDGTYTGTTSIKADGGTYTFSGWKHNGVVVSSVSNVTADITLTGSWSFEEDPIPKTYTVIYHAAEGYTFAYLGGTKRTVEMPVDTAIVSFGVQLNAPVGKSVTMSMYTDATGTNKNTPVTFDKDMVVSSLDKNGDAKPFFTAANGYQLGFTTFPAGSVVEILVSPATYAVTYDWGNENIPGGVTLPTTASLKHGTDYTVDTEHTRGYEVKTENGTYIFSGWIYDGAVVTSIPNVKAPIALIGSWVLEIDKPEPPITYSVTYKWDGAPDSAQLPKDALVDEGSTYTVDTAYARGDEVKTENGTYIFSGWIYDGAVVTSIPNVKAPIALIGSWVLEIDKPEPPITYSVTYKWDGAPDSAQLPKDALVDEGSTYTVDTNYVNGTSIKANGGTYTFSGWKHNDVLVSSISNVAAPISLTGSWSFVNDPPSGGGGDPVSRYTVTVNYLDAESNEALAESFESRRIISGSSYDVSAEVAKEIEGYTISSVDGETTGTLRRNLTINVYYTAEEIEILPEEPPLTDLPVVDPEEPEIEIPGEEVPLAPLPGTGNEPSGEEVEVLEGEVPLGNLPQTGTTAAPVNAALTLGLLALAFSMAAVGLTLTISRKKEDEA